MAAALTRVPKTSVIVVELFSRASRPAFSLSPQNPARTDASRQLCQACAKLSSRLILNNMVQYSAPRLDLSFMALSDATRRGIIDQLGLGEASISSLAERFRMTLTGIKKHIQVLERAGLVVTQKVGRVRTCRLGQRGLAAEAEWIEARRQLFEARFDALDKVISEMEQDDGDE